jgi:hypothetical protein
VDLEANTTGTRRPIERRTLTEKEIDLLASSTIFHEQAVEGLAGLPPLSRPPPVHIATEEHRRQASEDSDTVYDEYHAFGHTLCSICLGEFIDNGSIRRTEVCQHAFHSICLERWLRRYKARCPLCNLDLFKLLETDGR